MSDSIDLVSILSTLRALGPDENPYLALKAIMRAQLYPPIPDWYFPQLHVNSAIQAVVLVLALAGLLGKAIGKNSFWTFRLRHTPRGRLLLPNGVILLCLAIVFACIFGQAFIWSLYAVYKNGRDPAALHAVTSLMWLFLQLAIWADNWALATSAYLSAPQSSHAWLARIPALAVNIFFIGLPIIYVASTQPVFAISIHHFRRGYAHFSGLQTELDAAAATWSSGTPFRIQPTWISEVDALLTSMASYIHWNAAGYGVTVAFLGFAALSFFPLAYLHCDMLRKQMQAFRHGKRKTEVDAPSDEQTHLNRSYGSMVAETAGVAVVILVYIALAGALCADLQRIFTTGTGIAVTTTLALYVFSFLSLPTHLLIARRIWQPYYAPFLSSLHSSFLSSRHSGPRQPTVEHRVELPLSARWTLQHPPTSPGAPTNTILPTVNEDEKRRVSPLGLENVYEVRSV